MRGGDRERPPRGCVDRHTTGLVTACWKPVFKYVRLKWHATPDDAADLTQGFFLRALEKDFFAGFDPARARFRTYLAHLPRRIRRERTQGGQPPEARWRRHARAAGFRRGGARAAATGEQPGRRLRCLLPSRSGCAACLPPRSGGCGHRVPPRSGRRAFAAFERYDLASDASRARPTTSSRASSVCPTSTRDQ